jgi:CheY-like chemotaxis protein
MAAGVAHEVNNPLSVVLASAELLVAQLRQHQVDSEDTKSSAAAGQRLHELLKTALDLQSAADRMRCIVADLRAFTRPVPQSAHGAANVANCISWAVRSTAQEFQCRARLITNLSEVPTVLADEVRLGQVLVNLLVNAAHAIEPGDAERNSVTISSSAHEHGWVVIEVRDTGCGIPNEDLAHIFEPFFTTKDPSVGTGLGLSICHGIVTSIGGELSVDSTLGQGTRFVIRLRASNIEEPAALRTGPQARGPSRRSRVLAVDEDEMVLRMLERMLRQHDVVCVPCGREALGVIEQHADFDLVLCDLSMPTMNGIQFYETLLGRDAKLARRVVFLTGGALNTKVDDFLRSVSNPRLDKPFSLESLMALVEQSIYS